MISNYHGMYIHIYIYTHYHLRIPMEYAFNKMLKIRIHVF